MNKFVLNIILALLFVSCSRPNKVESFSKTLISALQRKDFREFKRIIVTPEDLGNGLVPTLNSKDAQQLNSAEVEEYRSTYLNNYNSLFIRLLEQGESIGIVWTEIKFDNILYNEIDPAFGGGVHFLNGHINLKMQNQNFIIYGIDAQEYSDGYKVSYIKEIKRGTLEKYIDSNNLTE